MSGPLSEPNKQPVGEKEIEVTEQMIEAGINVYRVFHILEAGDEEDVVRAVFQEMIAASHKFTCRWPEENSVKC